jgi:V-type H+-transporting ATPase subunit A
MGLREKMRQILQAEDELTEIVQLVGKDSLSEDQKAVLKTADIIKNEFLQQNSFSDYDYNCPLWKTIGMMKAIVMFYTNSTRLILDTQKRAEQKMSMAQIEMFLSREESGNIMDRIVRMKFQNPAMPKDEMKRWFDDLHSAINKAFNDLSTQGMRV